MVAGGDGWARHAIAASIRATVVQPTTTEACHPYDPSGLRPGDNRYHRVEGMPLVDGVFIPDGRHGPVQLDSAGHRFDEFSTSQNMTSSCIWAGCYFPNDPQRRTVLNGIDYASPGHGLLTIHANQGITFDLDAIRRANPGCKLAGFRATVANVETGSDQGLSVWADVWVFVDGQVQFRRREINAYNGAMPAAVPLHGNQRFLTLVAADGNNSINYDWIVFGDPRLELEQTSAADNAARPATR